jgi:hypothetical protein
VPMLMILFLRIRLVAPFLFRFHTCKAQQHFCSGTGAEELHQKRTGLYCTFV